MLPVSLENRVEEIFKEMGGLTVAKSYFKEEEITDICLFNGFTEILFPYYKPFVGSLNSGLYDYKSLDLSLINYQPSSYICVTDKDYKPLYNTTIVPEVIAGKLSYYFGRSDSDRDFLQSCTDGKLLYLLYQTATSPCLAQIIVSHRLPVSVIELNRNLWEAGLKKVSLDVTTYSELVVNNSLDCTVTMFRQRGSLVDNFNEADIAYSNIYQGYSYNNVSQFFQFRDSSWVCFRAYSDYEEPDIYTIIDQQALKDLLISRSYTLAASTQQGYVMTKINDVYTYEIVVAVEEDQAIDSVSSSKYRKLALTNIEGDNIDYVTALNGAYYLNTKKSHTQGSATMLTTKSTFKLQADLNYV